VLLAVTVRTLLPVAGFGLNDAVTAVGRPDAVRLTLPLNPFDPATVIPDVLTAPGTTVTVEGEAPSVKLGGFCVLIPFSAMFCDAYPGAAAFKLLSVRVRKALRAPVAPGTKLTGNRQDAPGASVPAVEDPLLTSRQSAEPPLLKVKFAPMLGLLPLDGTGKVNAALPTFSTVTVCGLSLLVEPTTVVANVRLGASE